MSTISFVEHLSDDIREQMERGLKEYESGYGIDVNYKPFALVLKNDWQEVIGVLEAFTSYSCLHIVDLWVEKSCRGQGCGRMLIYELERLFKDKNLHNINTVTCAFQAPGFYEKCGFKVEFVRENKIDPKLTMTFFIKEFE